MPESYKKPKWRLHPERPSCGTDGYIALTLRQIRPGDYGNLDVRRPSAPISVIKWRTVKLGDE